MAMLCLVVLSSARGEGSNIRKLRSSVKMSVEMCVKVCVSVCGCVCRGREGEREDQRP